MTLKCEGEEEKIDLIRTTEHILTTITQFHSTAVMNYISFYGIVCLYPEWTLRRYALVTRRNVPCRIVDKYRAQGFKMVFMSAELAKYNLEENLQWTLREVEECRKVEK